MATRYTGEVRCEGTNRFLGLNPRTGRWEPLHGASVISGYDAEGGAYTGREWYFASDVDPSDPRTWPKGVTNFDVPFGAEPSKGF